MLYGVLLEGVREGIILFHGDQVWKRIVQEMKLPSETFDLFKRYDHRVLLNISECMAYILHNGTRETYLEAFGRNFIIYLIKFGYDKILRVAGRTVRDFLFAIDQLHDSNRFAFPQMIQPLFHVTEENVMGVTLDYKSTRHGLAPYAIGGLISSAKILFREDIKVDIINDSSTKEYDHLVFWVQFNNKTFQRKRINYFPTLPVLHSQTFFRVFPFSILMNSCLNIQQIGEQIEKVFPRDTELVGRPLNEVFRLIRPDIHVEWDKILSYGRHIVFLMENRLPLRIGSSGRIRLKGQMKYLEDKNMIWFLCHPVLGSADDMISAGLHLTDLNLFDSTSDLLITSIHQERQIEEAIANQQVLFVKLQQSKGKLIKWHRKSQRLLYSILPKHIALMLQSGIQPNCICESHPLVTVLFAYMTEFELLTVRLDPSSLIECLNEIISTFDKVNDKYDVFKIETKADASYMVVAGLRDRFTTPSIKDESPTPSVYYDSNDEHDNVRNDKVDKNPLGLHQTEIIASLALNLLEVTRTLINPITQEPFKVKFGFHSGTAVGGIVGQTNFQYCLFGDTINMASRITTTSEVGRIHLSHSSYGYLTVDNRFITEYRGRIEMKGKGTNSTYWLIGKAKKTLPNVINKTSTMLKCPFSGGFNNNYHNGTRVFFDREEFA